MKSIKSTLKQTYPPMPASFDTSFEQQLASLRAQANGQRKSTRRMASLKRIVAMACVAGMIWAASAFCTPPVKPVIVSKRISMDGKKRLIIIDDGLKITIRQQDIWVPDK